MDAHEIGNGRLDRYVAHINDSEVAEVTATVLAWKGEQFLGVHDAVPPETFSRLLNFFSFDLGRQKDLHARAIGVFLDAIGADAYAYVDEAWTVSRKKENINVGPSPANSADRTEAILMHYEHKSGPQLGRIYPLNRVQGVIRLNEPVPDLTFKGEGRYTRLFNKYGTE